jgi:arsenate reductase-like glutaredoxin family protein
MALEARNEMNRKHLAHISKASEEERQHIMRIKAEKYDKLKRGDYGVLSEKELAEITVNVSQIGTDVNLQGQATNKLPYKVRP